MDFQINGKNVNISKSSNLDLSSILNKESKSNAPKKNLEIFKNTSEDNLISFGERVSFSSNTNTDTKKVEAQANGNVEYEDIDENGRIRRERKDNEDGSYEIHEQDETYDPSTGRWFHLLNMGTRYKYDKDGNLQGIYNEWGDEISGALKACRNIMIEGIMQKYGCTRQEAEEIHEKQSPKPKSKLAKDVDQLLKEDDIDKILKRLMSNIKNK